LEKILNEKLKELKEAIKKRETRNVQINSFYIKMFKFFQALHNKIMKIKVHKKQPKIESESGSTSTSTSTSTGALAAVGVKTTAK